MQIQLEGTYHQRNSACKRWAGSLCGVDACHSFWIQSVTIMSAIDIMDQKHPPCTPYNIVPGEKSLQTDKPSFLFSFFLLLKARGTELVECTPTAIGSVH